MKTRTRVRSWGDRLAASALGAVVAAIPAALLEARWAQGQADPGVSIAGLFADDLGLLAPVALLVGLGVGAAAIFVAPDEAPSPASLVAALRVRAFGRQADVAAFTPLVVLVAFLWSTAVAHLARAVLALDVAPSLVGIGIAAGALAAGLVAAALVLVLTPPLRHALANASETRRATVDPAVTGGVALGVVAALLAFGVATGTVSGEHGFFGIWGIFKRPELDLRAVSLGLAMVLAAFFMPTVPARPRGFVAALLALLSLLLTVRASTALGKAPEHAQAIERGAPVGNAAVRLLRRLTDRDHDGFSGLFGGGDCNDGDARINPQAKEIPDDGVDQDCSGSDLSSKAVAAAIPTVGPAAPPPEVVPDDVDIVVITVDTLRADLGFMGYARPVSPNLDALAAESTVFDRAYSLASYTGKSVGPLLIGKYGSETHRNWGHFNKFGTEDRMLAERLHDAGYRTISVQAHRYFGAFSGLDRGFDVVDMDAAPPEGTKWDVDAAITGDKLTDAALAELAKPENTKGRFFLWMHYVDPHADYMPHEGGASFGPSQRDLYDGEIAFVDAQIGRVLAAIRAAPWGKKTAIVVTSDHGEAFGEHKMYRHGFELWEPLVHVPLVVRVPGAKPSRVAARRSAIDVVPTLVALGHAKPPSGDGDDFVSGASLLPDVFAKEPPGARDVLVDMPAGPYNDARRALVHGDLKLIVSNEAHFELYDLAKDPGEEHNIWGTEARADIEPVYAAWKARLREIRVTGQRK